MEKLFYNVYIWGTGKRARELNEFYAYELKYVDVAGYIDNDERNWGKEFFGKKIFSPEILRESGRKIVCVYNRFSEEIQRQLVEQYSDCDIEITDEKLIYRIQIILRYCDSKDGEIREIVDYLRNHPLDIFNYDFKEKYNNYDIELGMEHDLFYTFYDNKKIYFLRKLDTEEKCRKYFKSLLIEQDKDSPHLYLENFEEVENAVVIDAGVAEGNFSLSIIDKAKRIYMFEPDEDWCEALRYTFEPYKEKVIIINKFLSDYCNEVTVKIDDVVDEKVNCIKLDIEGEEIYALKGGQRVIENSDEINIYICTYHQEFAYDVIRNYVDNLGFKSAHSKGYMWYPGWGFRDSILRRGVLRSKKSQ